MSALSTPAEWEQFLKMFAAEPGANEWPGAPAAAEEYLLVTERWLLLLGVAPGGSSWVRRDNHFESTQSLSSWNLTAGAGYRFYEKFRLFAGVGVAGFRGVNIESAGNADRLESKPSPVFSRALQFRP